ncbi:MAG: SpoIIE family protein phosphatase [Bacteroidia bacterium]
MHLRPYLNKIVVLFSLFTLQVSSQDDLTKKQLYDILSKQAADTVLIDTYNAFCWPIYCYDNFDSAIYFGNKAIELSKKIKDIKRESIAHRRLGIVYTNTSDIKTALFHQQTSYDLSEKIHYKRGMQLALNNLGVIYLNNELLNKALGYFLKSLKMVEETNDYRTASNLYVNCGIIYRGINELNKAKEFFLKANSFAKLKSDDDILIISFCELSSICRNLKQVDSAEIYLNKAKKYVTATTTPKTKFSIGINEGLIFSVKKENRKALACFLKTQEYSNILTDGITLFIDIGDEYNKLNKPDSAFHYFKKGYDVSVEHKLYDNIEYLSYQMALYYKNKNDFKNYSKLLEIHLNAKDSSSKITTAQKIIGQQLEFDFQKKQVADSIGYSQKEKISNAQLEVANVKLSHEKIFRIMLILILVIIIVFAVFIYNRFRLAAKQKKIIEEQKHLVDEKNKEILDSINYAKRLQEAILPQKNDIQKDLDFDIFYLPKDIIGGDFYFFEKHNNYIFIAVCDCTGHGIPGAIMSVVCHHALQKSIIEFNLTEPKLILDKTREIVIASLNATQQNIKDGMDCSLIVLNIATKKIKWAGANNPLWILNNNLLTEIKATKQPVALYEAAKPFTDHELELAPDTLLYLFTDGYPDQFGGPKGKKYKEKQLKEFLISIAGHPLQKQIELLRQNFASWKGNQDQVDDVALGIIKLN